MFPRDILVERLEQRRLLSAGDLDPFFDMSGVANATLSGAPTYALMATQPDGKFVAAAPIRVSPGNSEQLQIVRFRPDGSMDDSFGDAGKLVLPRAFADGGDYPDISRPLIDRQGRILEYANGKLMRFISAGRYDRSFGDRGIVQGAGSHSMVLLSDGRILAATGNTVRRYDSTGALDRTFGNQGVATIELPSDLGDSPSFANDLDVKPDGTILLTLQIGSGSTTGTIDAGIVEFTNNGKVKRSYGDNGLANVQPFASNIGPDETVVTADGGTVTLTSHEDGGSWLVKLTSEGKFDNGFGQRGVQDIGNFYGNRQDASIGINLFLGADQKLTAVYQLDGAIGVTRSLSNGKFDKTFAGDGKTFFDFGRTADASVALNGDVVFAKIGFSGDQANLLELDAVQSVPVLPGQVDPTFGKKGVVTRFFGGEIQSAQFIVQRDRKIVAGVTVATNDPKKQNFVLTRFSASGKIDTSFGTAGKTTVPLTNLKDANASGPFIDGAGHILVEQNGQLMRFTNSGQLDSGFGAGGIIKNFSAQEIAVRDDGKFFATIGRNVERFLANGNLDTSFGTNGKVLMEFGLPTGPEITPLYPAHLAIEHDGSILVGVNGGDGLSGDTTPGIVHLLSSGKIDRRFGEHGLSLGNSFDFVHSVAALPDGRVAFTSFGDVGEDLLTVLDSRGHLDKSFGDNGTLLINPNQGLFGALIYALPNGKLFTDPFAPEDIDNNDLIRLVRLNPNGEHDPTFASGTEVVHPFALAKPAPNGDIVVVNVKKDVLRVERIKG